MRNKSINIMVLIVIAVALLVTTGRAESKAEWPATMNPIAPIAIVGIDDDTLYYIGNNKSDNQMYRGDFPIPRIWYAKLVDILRAANAQVVAIDYVFLSIPPINKPDVLLARAVAAGPPPIVVGFDLIPTKHNIEPNINLGEFALPGVSKSVDTTLANALALPYEELVMSGASLGAVNILKDEDGAVRRGSLVVNNGQYMLPSMALQIFMQIEGISPRDISISGGAMNVRGIRIPVARESSLNVALPPANTVFKRYSMIDIVKPKDEFKSDAMEKHMEKMKEYFEGKIVIIGPMDISLKDIWDTPAGRMYPGVEIIASTTNHLLNIWARARGISKPVWEPTLKEVGYE